MLGDRRLFDDMARVASGAAGAVGGLKSRMEGELRDHVDRVLLRMNLVTRADYDVVLALAQKARTEQEMLGERVGALEARLADAVNTQAGLQVPAPAKPQAPAKTPAPAKTRTAAPRRRSGPA
jgi:BMFP domain-containing protein YqiC